VLFLKTNIEERACDLAVYIIENKATVRSAAKQFGISKSTVHAVVTNWNAYGLLYYKFFILIKIESSPKAWSAPSQIE